MKYKKRRHSISHIWHHTRKRRVLAVLLLLFVIGNVIIAGAYRNQTYPGTRIDGQPIGSVRHTELEDKLKKLQLLPDTIRLTHDKTTIEMPVSDIGAAVDYRQITQYLTERRPWLPVANLFVNHDAPLFVAIKPDVYQKKVASLADTYKKAAVNANLDLRNGDFVITPEVNAVIFDASATQANIVEALQKGRQSSSDKDTQGVTAAIKTKQVAPAITKASLSKIVNPLQAQRNTAISLTYGTQSRQFSPEETGNWFVGTAGPTPSFSLSEAKIRTSVTDAGLELGVSATNAEVLATNIKRSMESRQTNKLALAGNPVGKKAYTFCTASRNVAASEIGVLASKATETLNAKRGWSLGGNITFTHTGTVSGAGQEATAGCDFTLWLSSADQMPSFGAICDSMWSCAVKPNVIINIDRWNNASEAWNKNGGSIEDYRVMVINHEVGHWLGFDHSSCPAGGQAAPVMQQQSINLQGCTFSPWPSAVERSSLKNYLGL